MLKLRIGRMFVGISIWFAAFFAVVIFVSGSRFLLLCLFAMLCHEAGHLLAMSLVGCPARGIVLLMGRMVIQPARRPPAARQELWILSGGILANLICAVLFYLFGETDACLINLLIAAYNALPAGELDGGAMLLNVLGRRNLPRRAHAIHLGASVVVSLCLLTAGFFILLRGYRNITPVMSGIYLMAQNIRNLQYTR